MTNVSQESHGNWNVYFYPTLELLPASSPESIKSHQEGAKQQVSASKHQATKYWDIVGKTKLGWWDNLTPRTIWHLGQFDTDHARRTIWHLGQFDTIMQNRTIWHRPCKEDNLTPRTIWHLGQFDTIMQNRTIWHRPCREDNLTPRTIWHLGQFDTIINFIFLQLFGPKIWLEIYWLPLSIFLTENYPV